MGLIDLKKEGTLIKRLISLSALGLTLVIAIMIGFGIGYYLDLKFNTKPWLTLTFFLLVWLQVFGQCSKRCLKR